MSSPTCADPIRPALRAYVEQEILPRYDAFDKGHRRDHAWTVIRQALELATHYDADPEMVYTAAAYHDTGLCEDRKTHHLVSGRIIREDSRLREWFSEAQIETIAQAAEDHRASSDHAPRTLYGRLIAEADRQIIPETVIRRTVQFGLKHYPERDKEGHWERTLEHLGEKYAEGGYLKLWIPESPNAERLAELRDLIRDRARLRACFERIYHEETDMRIVFLDASTLGATSLEPIRALGTLVTYPTSTPEEALGRVAEADVLIINKVKVTEALLAAAPRLKLVCEAATGVNNIDLEAAARRGIPVRNVAGYSTDAVVQLTFTQILDLLCGPERFDAEVKDGSYSRSPIFTDVSRPFAELAGKTLGVIGMGTIGQRVARVATAFGMRVIYFSTSGTSHCTDYPSVPLETLLADSDVVSIHAPLNPRTAGLVGAAELARMKPTALIVNMARGGIIDEQALADAISAGTIAGAAVDVFTAEPILADNPLLHTAHPERLRLTPHVAWASAEALDRLVAGIADNIRALRSASL